MLHLVLGLGCLLESIYSELACFGISVEAALVVLPGEAKLACLVIKHFFMLNFQPLWVHVCRFHETIRHRLQKLICLDGICITLQLISDKM